jgi:hypothetical protein
MHQWYTSYAAFLVKYPYCNRKVWGAFLLDHAYLIVDLWALLTLHVDYYGTRESVDTELDGSAREDKQNLLSEPPSINSREEVDDESGGRGIESA